MKGQALHITFHNPNTKSDSEYLAKDFISRAAVGALEKMISNYQNTHIKQISSESECDLD